MTSPTNAADALSEARASLRQLQERGIRIPFLAGAELRLAEFVHEDPGAAACLLNSPGGDASLRREALMQLQWFLGAQGPDDQLFRAGSILRVLGATSWLDPEPLLCRLSGLEYGGAFYDRYRDHVTHTLLVYLLGAYLVRRCRALREALAAGTRSGDDVGFAKFVAQWRIAALFHDVGYLYENARPDSAQGAMTLLEAYPELLWRRLADLARAAGSTPPADLPPTLRQAVRSAVILRDVFDLFRPLARPVRVGNADPFVTLSGSPGFPRGLEGGLRAQFDRGRGAERSRLDHGIMSALVVLRLLELADVFLEQAAADAALDARARLVAEKEKRTLEAGVDSVVEAAAAVAVHNIRLADPHPGAIYCVRLDDQPWAFLLRLADSLQDWDRRYFRSVMELQGKPGLADLNRPRSAQDVDVRADDDMVRVSFAVTDRRDAERVVADFNDLKLDADRRLVPPQDPPEATREVEWFRIEFPSVGETLIARSIEPRAECGVETIVKSLQDRVSPSSVLGRALALVRIIAAPAGAEPGPTAVDFSPALLLLYEAGYTAEEAREALTKAWTNALPRNEPAQGWTWTGST